MFSILIVRLPLDVWIPDLTTHHLTSGDECVRGILLKCPFLSYFLLRSSPSIGTVSTCRPDLDRVLNLPF